MKTFFQYFTSSKTVFLHIEEVVRFSMNKGNITYIEKFMKGSKKTGNYSTFRESWPAERDTNTFTVDEGDG